MKKTIAAAKTTGLKVKGANRNETGYKALDSYAMRRGIKRLYKADDVMFIELEPGFVGLRGTRATKVADLRRMTIGVQPVRPAEASVANASVQDVVEQLDLSTKPGLTPGPVDAIGPDRMVNEEETAAQFEENTGEPAPMVTPAEVSASFQSQMDTLLGGEAAPEPEPTPDIQPPAPVAESAKKGPKPVKASVVVVLTPTERDAVKWALERTRELFAAGPIELPEMRGARLLAEPNVALNDLVSRLELGLRANVDREGREAMEAVYRQKGAANPAHFAHLWVLNQNRMITGLVKKIAEAHARAEAGRLIEA